MREQYHVQPGMSWGTLPLADRRRWSALRCDTNPDWCELSPSCGAHLGKPCMGVGTVCRPIVPPRGSSAFFQSTCTHGDHGWPRFASLDALAASPWAQYLRSVYGELPLAGEFPLCTFDFWSIDKVKLDSSGVTSPAHAPSPVATRVQHAYDETRFKWIDGEFFARRRDTHPQYYHGYAIYHSDRPYIRSRQWVEVTHHVATNTRGTGFESSDPKYANMWFIYAPGSGVWYFTGRAGLFDSHVHAARALCANVTVSTNAAIANDNTLALCARRAGFDTLAFRTSRTSTPELSCRLQEPDKCWTTVTTNGTVATWGHIGMMELFATRLSGRWPCGNPSGDRLPRFRAGWRASRECVCDNSSVWLNCRV